MTFSERLIEDMKTSMKASDIGRTGTVRLLRAAMKNEEIKSGHVLSDSEAIVVFRREAKQRRDSIAAYKSAGREDLVSQEQLELDIINSYLPAALPESELAIVVKKIIDQTGATDMTQMGRVVAAVKSEVGDKAEGGDIARLVKERLVGDQA
ncbi:GatB/YqeY domain-containing protein [bacterium]|nr:MAG: GatB/YqeY domain-containing protein [bacterium]